PPAPPRGSPPAPPATTPTLRVPVFSPPAAPAGPVPAVDSEGPTTPQPPVHAAGDAERPGTGPLGPAGPAVLSGAHAATPMSGAHAATPTPGAHSVSPARGPARRRAGLRVVAIALTVAVAAAGATFLATRDRGAPEPGPSPTATGSGTPQPTASGDTDPPPTGYRWVDDPAGFRFPLPVATPAWQRSTDTANQIFYSPDNKTHYLQFAVTVGQSVKPLEHLRQMETTVSKLKEYRQHKLTSVLVNGHDAAVWEFSYAAKEGGRRRAIEAEFIDRDGTGYAIYLSSPDTDKDWPEGEQRFNAVLKDFTPTR
ncbi:hypothetical protein ACFVXQ_28870, partial [Kitasatospora sp. NPDC058263]